MSTITRSELEELVRLYTGMDKLARAIWIGNASLLLGKEAAEKMPEGSGEKKTA